MRGAREPVVHQVGVHLAEAEDAVAEGALRGAGAVLELVGGEAREAHLGCRGAVAALRHFEVAKLAEDGLGGAVCRPVAGQLGEIVGREGTGRAVVLGVEDSMVSLATVLMLGLAEEERMREER